jgi:hypothetical protein
MSQTKRKSALEAGVNTVVGIVLNQLILWAAGIPLGTATFLTVVMVGVSFLRSYIVRRMFT